MYVSQKTWLKKYKYTEKRAYRTLNKVVISAALGKENWAMQIRKFISWHKKKIFKNNLNKS